MLHMTPAMLEAAYELLRATPPFKGWKLPPGDEVAFHILRTRAQQADHCLVGNTHQIRVSAAKHATLRSLLETVAHEMIHVREVQLRARPDVAHGKLFNRLADKVCREHGFDRGQF